MTNHIFRLKISDPGNVSRTLPSGDDLHSLSNRINSQYVAKPFRVAENGQCLQERQKAHTRPPLLKRNDGKPPNTHTLG